MGDELKDRKEVLGLGIKVMQQVKENLILDYTIKKEAGNFPDLNQASIQAVKDAAKTLAADENYWKFERSKDSADQYQAETIFVMICRDREVPTYSRILVLRAANGLKDKSLTSLSLDELRANIDNLPPSNKPTRDELIDYAVALDQSLIQSGKLEYELSDIVISKNPTLIADTAKALAVDTKYLDLVTAKNAAMASHLPLSDWTREVGKADSAEKDYVKDFCQKRGVPEEEYGLVSSALIQSDAGSSLASLSREQFEDKKKELPDPVRTDLNDPGKRRKIAFHDVDSGEIPSPGAFASGRGSSQGLQA